MNRESLKKVFDIVVMWAALTATSLVALWAGGMISTAWISLLIWCWESGALAISVFTCVHIGAIWTAAVESSSRKSQTELISP